MLDHVWVSHYCCAIVIPMATQSTKKKSTSKTKTTKAAKKAAVQKNSSTKRLAVFRRRKSAATKQVTAASLRTWHKWLALLFAAQGVAILIISATQLIPVVANYLAIDTLASKGGETVRVPAVQHLFDANVAYLVAGICFVFALSSLLAVTLYRAVYEQGLQKGVNRFRWTTLSLGLGASVVLLGLLVGVQDIASLLLLFALVIVVHMSAFGLELLGSNNQQLRSAVSVAGTLAWLAVWVVLALYFVGAGLYDGSIPTYVYWLGASLLVLSSVLVSLFRKQQAGSGKWADYLRTERTFLAVNFVLITALTWQVFIGTLQP